MVDIEIGAFQSEVGCKQRVKFNIILEVEKNPAIFEDNVDKILSYETIIEAIWLELNSKRFNLLETLAEQVAERCMMEKKAERVIVRIEKLDKIVGSLGVEISRDKIHYRSLKNKSLTEKGLNGENALILAHLTNGLIYNELAESWLRVFKKSEVPVVISLDPLTSVNFQNVYPKVQNEVRLLSMAQSAVIFDNLYGAVSLVRNKAELDLTTRMKKVSVILPTKIFAESTLTSPSVILNTKELALLLAKAIKATRLIFIGDPVVKDSQGFDSEILQVDYLAAKEWMKF